MSHPHNYFSDATDHALSYAIDAFDIQPAGKHILTIDAPNTAATCGGENWIRYRDLAPQSELYDLIFVNANGHKRETYFTLAQSVARLKQNGQIIIAGANDTGGKSIATLCDDLGLKYNETSKFKHRIFHIHNIADYNAERGAAALRAGELHQRDDGFWTRVGIFSWDEIDKGSALFLKSIAGETVSGRGADFGCGIGVLGHHLLSTSPAITQLDSIDIDIRAVQCAQKNLESFGERSNVIHGDATTYRANAPYDFIISNPPFHTGKATTISLGQSFIMNAAANLKQNGIFYMVANQTLPYEDILTRYFKGFTPITNAGGFKIYKAQK